jgi:two-component system chemotaxis response regulator CheY
MTMRRIVIDAVRALTTAEILEATSAEDALTILYHSGDIGLMLLDYHLPGMTGLELLRKMKDDPKVPSVPVVMVTTEREKASVIAALRAGAKNYIVKPFSQTVFKKKVGPLLDAHGEHGADRTGRLVGSLGQTSPLEVIQLIAMTKKTGVLEFEGHGLRFEIFFRNGQIQHANGPDVTGEQAVDRATELTDGVFTFRKEAIQHPVTIRRSTEMLMLEAMGKHAPK